jgi:hypothetical protein
MTFVAATFRLRYFRSGDTGAATVYGLYCILESLYWISF